MTWNPKTYCIKYNDSNTDCVLCMNNAIFKIKSCYQGGAPMKCDICGKTHKSFYVYYKGNNEFGKRCKDCDYKERHREKLCLKKESEQ